MFLGESPSLSAGETEGLFVVYTASSAVSVLCCLFTVICFLSIPTLHTDYVNRVVLLLASNGGQSVDALPRPRLLPGPFLGSAAARSNLGRLSDKQRPVRLALSSDCRSSSSLCWSSSTESGSCSTTGTASRRFVTSKFSCSNSVRAPPHLPYTSPSQLSSSRGTRPDPIGAAWSSTMAVHAYALVRGKEPMRRRVELGLHAALWTWWLLSTLTVTLLGLTGPSGALWCQMKTVEMVLLLFYLPLYLSLFCALVFIVLVTRVRPRRSNQSLLPQAS